MEEEKSVASANGTVEMPEPAGTVGTEEETKTVEEKKTTWKDDLVWFAKVLLVASVVSLCVRFLTPLIFVDGESMYPTLYDKELCVGCTFIEPKQGDIIIFKNANTMNKTYIKRVIGVPGDHVQIENDVVYINGEKLEEDYAYFNEELQGRAHYSDIDVTLEAGQYFVCGDNRYESRDSRIFGYIMREDIQAKVILQIDLRWFTNLFRAK